MLDINGQGQTLAGRNTVVTRTHRDGSQTVVGVGSAMGWVQDHGPHDTVGMWQHDNGLPSAVMQILNSAGVVQDVNGTQALGSNAAYCGGSRYIGYLTQHAGGTDFTYGSLGDRFGFVPLGCGRDGTIALIARADLTRFVLHAPSGAMVTVPAPDPVYHLCIITDAQAIWNTDGYQVRAFGLPLPAVLDGQGANFQVLNVAGEAWVAYYSPTRGLVAHPYLSHAVGFTVPHTVENAYYVKARAVFDDGRWWIVFAWSLREGELPEDIQTLTVDPADARPFDVDPPTSGLEARVAVLEVQMADVQRRLTALEQDTPDPPGPVFPEDIPSQLHVVTAVRARYPTPLGASHAACLIDLAHSIVAPVAGFPLYRAGLLLKEGGTVVELPTGVEVAQDIIAFPDGRIFDCLGDAEGAAVPQWGEANGSPVNPDRYYQV